MKISDSLSRQLATVTFASTILVVMCHCDDRIENKSALVRFLGGIFSDGNVANFFFLSGFFVARHFDNDGWYRKTILRRLYSLGVPYLLWCLIFHAIYILASKVELLQRPCGTFDVKNIFGIGFTRAPIDFALWYIKTLFYFIIVSPLFFILQRRYKFAFPILFVLLLILQVTPISNFIIFNHFCFNIVGFICFLMGAEVAFSQTMQRVFFNGHKIGGNWWVVWLSLWLFVAMIVSKMDGVLYTILHPIYIIFAVFCLQKIVSESSYRIPVFLSKSAFVIYATHMMTLQIISPKLNMLFGNKSFFCFVILLAFSVFGGIFLTAILRKLSPKILALLTGGRG